MSYSLHAAQDTPDTGYFQANITATTDAKPVSGATVQIRDINFPENIIAETQTDADGKTETIELPTPPLEYSMIPESEQPYASYVVRINAPDFEPVEINGAEVLSGETALQNTQLIPITESMQSSAELFVIPPHTLYGEYPPKIAESEIKVVEETGEIVLSRVVIPAGVRKQALTGLPPSERLILNRQTNSKAS